MFSQNTAGVCKKITLVLKENANYFAQEVGKKYAKILIITLSSVCTYM
jgi:hypothetical protein